MRGTGIIIGFALAALAASPSPSDDVAEGIVALDRGDAATAEARFQTALERSPDPGVVAFNLGVIRAGRKDYAEAERWFARCLGDEAAPTERRDRANFNRGTCLLHLGGMNNLRTAIELFQRCEAAEDENFRRDATANLELAKILWLAARPKAKEPPKPNQPPPDAPPEKKGSQPQNQEGSDAEGQAKSQAKIDPLTGRPKPNATPQKTDATTGGRGHQPVRIDPATWRPANESEARNYLPTLAARLARDRRTQAELHANPERADVKDW